MRKLPVFALLLALALAITACGGSKSAPTAPAPGGGNTAPAAEAPPLRIGVINSLGTTPPLVAAEANKLFDKYKVKVETTVVTTGKVGDESMAAGKLDGLVVGIVPQTSALAAGVPAQIVGLGGAGGDRYALLVGMDSTARSITDLKGKKLGLPIGSGSEMYLDRLLASVKMSRSDFQIINTDPTDMAQALKTKQLDGALVWEPTPSLIELAGAGKPIWTGKEMGNLANLITVKTDYIQKYPQVVVGFVKAWIEASQWATDHPEQLIDLMAERFKLDKNMLRKAIPRSLFYVEIFQSDLQDMKDTAKFLYDNKKTQQQLNVDKALNLQILQQATGKQYPLAGKPEDVYKYPVLK